ncbi:MAG TPA: tetratricopeptide repeat protein [Steroidobacteraceae bacterium]|jgi:tetratricopeptide (TPR) repeat protein|nr:tetratricopeptide repeat protein [Steroidobacteraceae bacterium]
MRIALVTLSMGLMMAVGSPGFASGGGMMRQSAPPPPPLQQPRAETPAQKAAGVYNEGVRLVKKADKAQEGATAATDAGKKDKATREANDKFAAAHAKFEAATQIDPSMHEAWNYLGYTARNLGHYQEALAAYDKALSLKPGYPEALEYRGVACLGLDHVPDAKQAYLDLYPANRALADKLLSAMKAWVAAQRAAPGGAASGVDDFEHWIQERAQISAQTAMLTRAGTAASWR